MKFHFDQSAYWNQAAHQKTVNHALDQGWLSRHLPHSSNLMDVGCGMEID